MTESNQQQSTQSSEHPTCPICHYAGPVKTRTVTRANTVALCPNCKSVHRIPRPTFEDLQQIYNKDYYNAWGNDTSEETPQKTKQAIFIPLIDSIKQLLSPAIKEPTLLDVGAATGILSRVAIDQGFTVSAAEINPYSAALLRDLLGETNVFEGELPDSTFSPNSFDVITMTDVIEHVLDVDSYLTAARSLLKPNGLLVMTTPRIDSLSRTLMGKNWLHYKEEHIQYFSASAMRQTLAANGYKTQSIKTYYKRLSLDYLHRQLTTYPHGLLTPIAKCLHTILPKAITKIPIPYACGEMLIIATAR